MGHCLSCCHKREARTENGHHLSPVSGEAVCGPLPASRPFSALTDTLHSQPFGNDPYKGVRYHQPLEQNGDQDSHKMFNPYPKLPPIKRHSANGRDFSEAKVSQLFENYKDTDEDCIRVNGMERLCADLELRPEEFKVLALAWKMDAATMCRFTRAEFLGGCKRMRVDSIRGMQARLPDLLEEVQERAVFREFYRWTYRFGLDMELGQRTLPLDMALSLWRLVFSQNEPPVLARWLDFLEQHSGVRGIPRDTWDMFLNFVEQVGNDLSCYDDTEAWPSLFDDFVEYENDRQNQNVHSQKDGKSWESQDDVFRG